MLLGFKKRFVEPILIGTKVHTLRKPRKNEPNIGDKLHMYTGLRTTSCTVITKKEHLISVQKVRVLIHRYKVDTKVTKWKTDYKVKIVIDGRELTTLDQLNEFSKYDGFTDIKDFCQFWFLDEKKHTKKVGGIMNLYHWTDLRY